MKNHQKNQSDIVFSPKNTAWHSVVLPNKNTSPTTLPKKLIRDYLAAQYQVQIELHPIVTLHIGSLSEPVITLIQTTQTQNATYITACNPASHIATPAENQSATIQLYEQLIRYSSHIYTGKSIDPLKKWPAEASFLALGIDLTTATTIGHMFAQNAIVWMSANAIPQLILLR